MPRQSPEYTCHATKKNGERCGQIAARGQQICRYHGGALTKNVAAAERKEKEAEIQKFIGDIWAEDVEPSDNIHLDMHRLIARHTHLTEQVGRRMNATACECCGIGGEIDGPTYRALTTAMRDSFKMYAEAQKLDLLDRSVTVQEQQIAITVMAVIAAIEAAVPGIDYMQMHDVRRAFLKKLEELEKNPPELEGKAVSWR